MLEGRRSHRPVPADPPGRRPGPLPSPEQARPGDRGRGRRGLHRRTHPRLRGVRGRRPHGRLGRDPHRDGPHPREIDEALRLVLSSQRTIVCWAMGLTQHKHSVPTIQKRSSSCCCAVHRPSRRGRLPGRGHSNVQGDRTMGIFERPAPAFLTPWRRSSASPSPREHGYDVKLAIRALRDGDAEGLLRHGRQLRLRLPRHRRHRGRHAPRPPHGARLDQLNRSHVVTGARALILPTLGRTERDLQGGGEQFVTVEDSDGMVHASRGRLEPASEHLLSEPGHRLPPRPPRRPRRLLPHPLGGVREGLRHDPRPHRARGPRLRRLQRARRRPRRLRPPPRPPRRTPLPHRDRQGQLHRRARRVPEAPRRPPPPDPSARTTSTTPPSTASTTATGASRTAAEWSSSTPRTPAR